MKKIILLLVVLFASMLGVSAADCDYSCVAPYNLNNKFRAVFSNITGANALVENRLESILKKEVLKIASADEIKINIDSYSPKDLKNGIFKSLYVNGKNVVINNIYLDSLELKTLCDFNYIKQSGKEIVFVEEMPLSFSLSMTDETLNKTIQNEKYQKIIKDLNRIGNSYGVLLQIASTKVSVKNNKLYYVIGFDVPFINQEHKIVIQTDLRVKDGKINFNNTRLVSNKFNLNLSKLDFIINYLNPFDYSVQIFDNKNAKVIVKNVELKENKISASGVMVVPKD